MGNKFVDGQRVETSMQKWSNPFMQTVTPYKHRQQVQQEESKHCLIAEQADHQQG